MVFPLDPCSIPKYKNQLFIPPAFEPIVEMDCETQEAISYNYKVAAVEFMQQLLPKCFPKTKVWGYEGVVFDKHYQERVRFRSSPGATFDVVKDIPANVQWVNKLETPYFLPIDPTLHWTNPKNLPKPTPPFPPYPPGFPEAQSPVPIVTHLHGAEVRADSDGGPDNWFTAGEEITGPEFTRSNYYYPNEQEAATLWYHDHTLGTTRLSVYSGLAGLYLIRNPKNPVEHLLPNGKHEIPIVIQDRSFNEDGSLLFPNDGDNPEIHPYWRPAFIGNTIMVNGRVWPNLNVKRRQYRFRILNGSNFRHYNLKLDNQQTFTQIGTDGGFLPKPVVLEELLIAPGERADILIDFSKLEPSTKIIMTNDADAPFPVGETPNPETVGQIMQFTVLDSAAIAPNKLPPILNVIPKFTPDVPNRILTLNVVPGPNGTRELLLNGQTFIDPVSETPIVGSTEEWEIVSLTANSHPIHVHLIQYQIKNRQNFDKDRYQEEWIKLNGEPPLDHPTIPLAVEPFLIGEPMPLKENERGWKDTALALPNQVTRLLIRFAPQDANPRDVKPGVNLFSFDPSFKPGYVWHCHILDHEDNEMMRRMIVESPCNNNEEICCEITHKSEISLVAPAAYRETISYDAEISANVDKVIEGKIFISGLITRTIKYTHYLNKEKTDEITITDDTEFKHILCMKDVCEGDSFAITSSQLCKANIEDKDIVTNCKTNQIEVGKLLVEEVIKVYLLKDE